MRISSTLLGILGFSLACALPATAAPAKDDTTDQPAAKPAPKTPEPVTRADTATIAGASIPYRVTTGKLDLLDDEGKANASIFSISYTRADVKDHSVRPVIFAFNGGPGASSAWLNIGMLGPRILHLPEKGTAAPEPPARVRANPESLLDIADLVFIDPVTTGYSDATDPKKASDFHNVRSDIESVSDFIRRWVTLHDRWGSPKYLLGESYGGIRAAGVADTLQSDFGMSLNGVVLLSAVLDFATIQERSQNILSSLCFLPSYTQVALTHGRIQGDAATLSARAREFAFGEYATALLQGSALSEDRRKSVADTLATLTGIPTATWLAHDLRLSSSEFRAELLRDEGKVVGRFDARIAWGTGDKTSNTAWQDPSLSLAFGAFGTAMLDYLGTELGYKEEQPYELLTSDVQPWGWDSTNSVLDVSNRLSSAMRDNPRLRVLVMAAANDLATPAEGIAHTFRHLPAFPENLRSNITFASYSAGHMFYLNPDDLSKARKDLQAFVTFTP